MSTLVVVQARTGSSRLPAKVLLPLAGRPLLERMVERVLAASARFEIAIATTTSRDDDPIREIARTLGVRCFSGHPTDLLDRHHHAALEGKADVVVKIPSDCPLIDPAVIDEVIGAYAAAAPRFDYVSNLHPATFPDGNDVEVMSADALAIAFREARRPFEREHTTPFLWERPDRFRIGNVAWGTGLDCSMSHRFTIDYPEDYRFIKAVYDELWSPARPIFSLADILKLLGDRADIFGLNSRYAGVNWYRHHMNELTTVLPKETRVLEESR